MYSLSAYENREAEREQSMREKLSEELRSKKTSARMLRRIYNKTREEMVASCRARSRKWISEACHGTESWVRQPQASVFQHTFRDRQPAAEVGPTNGHVSGSKYIPRLVFTGGGELDRTRMADLEEVLKVQSPLRGNNPNALHNPCRPTSIILDTAKIRGRLEHPHWEAPRYFLRPREKEKEIGPDIQYADRNDMQRIYSGVIKNALFAWGEYHDTGPYASPTCRNEDPGKWSGDRPFDPGYKFRDNQWETMSGRKFPRSLLNADSYRAAIKYRRTRYPEKELARHRPFQLVVKSEECAPPDDPTRRSLRFQEEAPEPYPEGKTYFTSLRNEQDPSTVPADGRVGSYNARLRPRSSIEKPPVCKADGARKQIGRHEGETGGAGRSHLSEVAEATPLTSSPAPVLEVEKNAVGARTRPWQAEADKGIDVGRIDRVSSANRVEGMPVIQGTGGLRRGSEVASWAACGESDRSARRYLW